MKLHHLLIYCFLFFALYSCQNQAVQQEIIDLRTQLAEKTKIANQFSTEIQKLKVSDKGELAHIVYLKIKADADQAFLLQEIEKLKQIPGVQDLEIGKFKALGDKRALLGYDIIMRMNFADEQAYQLYQNHEIHHALRKNTLSLMAGPPVTYDFIIQ